MQTMDKSGFSVATLCDEGGDRAYWRVKTAIERLEAVAQMRRIIYGYDPATRLQRLFEVVNGNAVEYLLIGAYAVAYYGYPRGTILVAQ